MSRKNEHWFKKCIDKPCDCCIKTALKDFLKFPDANHHELVPASKNILTFYRIKITKWQRHVVSGCFLLKTRPEWTISTLFVLILWQHVHLL